MDSIHELAQKNCFRGKGVASERGGRKMINYTNTKRRAEVRSDDRHGRARSRGRTGRPDDDDGDDDDDDVEEAIK